MSPKPLLKKSYFMSPVEVVKVSTHNIEQAAKWCGGEIKTTESRRNPGRTDRYIDVPVPKGAALVMAFPGMYITKRIVISLENQIKISFAVFRRDFFEKNYWLEPLDAVDACWTRLANEEMTPELVAGTNQTTAVLNVHVASPGDVGKALEAARKALLENTDKAEVSVINVMQDGETLVTEPQIPAGLTPYEQRALITEDHVEDGVVPETVNVGLPRTLEETVHPSLRKKQMEMEGRRMVEEAVVPVTEMLDPTNFTGGAEIPVAIGDVHDPFKLAGSSHDPTGVLLTGNADAHAFFLRQQNLGGDTPDDRSKVQKVADKAAYDESLKNPQIAEAGGSHDPSGQIKDAQILAGYDIEGKIGAAQENPQKAEEPWNGLIEVSETPPWKESADAAEEIAEAVDEFVTNTTPDLTIHEINIGDPNGLGYVESVTEVGDAAQEVAGEPTTVGEELNQAGVGSASRHRDFLANGPSASGRSHLEAVADKAAYDAEMKEIEDGDPSR